MTYQAQTVPCNTLLIFLFMTFTFHIFVIGLVGCASAQTTGKESLHSSDIVFETYEIDTGDAKHQTILTGSFLSGDFTDIAVLNVDENNGNNLHIYSFINNNWKRKLTAPFNRELLFTDFANIAGHDRLIVYEEGTLKWFDPESMSFSTLVKIQADYNSIGGGKIPHIDITKDINHDGLDDIVFPQIDGFWISTQFSNGTFSNPVKLGPPEPFIDGIVLGEERSVREVGITHETIPLYLKRIYELDYNWDGRSDLVFWNEDHFDVHYQKENREFDTNAKSFTVDVPFDSDGVYSRLFDFSETGLFSQLVGFNKKTKRTVLYSFQDMNGDRITDMMMLTLEGRSVFKQVGRYEVHLGTSTPNKISFARDVNFSVTPRGKAVGMQPLGYAQHHFEDFDNDGQVDLLIKEVPVGFGGMVRAISGKSVPINLEYYCMENGNYPKKPTATRKVRRFAPLDGDNVFFPTVLVGDVNGDNYKDLLVGQNREELQIFINNPGSKWMAKPTQKVSVDISNDERNAWVNDLNSDGKDDILIYDNKSNKLTVLVVH